MFLKNFYISFESFFFNNLIPTHIIFFSTLIVLLPIVLITGSALPDIFLSTVSIYFLIYSLWNRIWSYYRNPIVYGFLFFSLFGFIRSLLSELPIESLINEGSIFYFRYIFFAMGVWYLLDNNPYLPKCLMYVSIICILIVSVDGLYQYFNGHNILGFQKFDNYRLTGLFGDEPIIGRYIAYISLFTFALIYQVNKKSKRTILLSFLLLTISEIVVFVSGERTPLFYLVIFSIIIVIFNPQYLKYRLFTALISFFIIYGILSINNNAKIRVVDLTVKQVNATYFPFLPYSDHHEEHYFSALKMFQDNPLFGVGTNLFRYQCNKDKYKYKTRSCNSHPHHYYIQLLAEMGIFGLLFLISFYLFLSSILIKQFINNFKSNKDLKKFSNYLLYPVILFIYWWPLIPHMSFYNNWNNVMIMLPLGFLMKFLYSKPLNGNTSKT